jgi:hypothetical protein
LTGNQQTIDIPCFKSYRANVTLPPNNGGDSSPITLHLESSDDKTLGAPSDSGAGTPIFYESIKPSNQLILNGSAPTITGDIDSEAKIVPNQTYAVDVFFEGAPLVPTITGIVPVGHDLTFTITLPQGSTFPGGTPVQVVLYKSL